MNQSSPFGLKAFATGPPSTEKRRRNGRRGLNRTTDKLNALPWILSVHFAPRLRSEQFFNTPPPPPPPFFNEPPPHLFFLAVSPSADQYGQNTFKYTLAIYVRFYCSCLEIPGPANVSTFRALMVFTFTALSAGSQTGKYYRERLGENEPKTGAFVGKEGRSGVVSRRELLLCPHNTPGVRWCRYD